MGGERGRFGKESRRMRPLWGPDLRLGALLTVGLAAKFAPPMLSVKLDKAVPVAVAPVAVAPTLAAAPGPPRPPTDALTNTLPPSVKAAAATAEEPPVLAAPVFAVDETKAPPLKPEPKPALPEPPKVATKAEPPKVEAKPDALDPLKPPAALPKNADDAPPPKPVKLKPPESIADEPRAPPILFADAPKKGPEQPPKPEEAPKPPEKKGPIHPYFQRYLDQKEYYVRPGDTLELIAHRLYQDEKKAADLLAANKDALPTADALKPGVTLKLP